RPGNSSTGIRIEFCLALTPSRMAQRRRSRFSASCFTKSTSASSKPKTSISITPRADPAARAMEDLWAWIARGDFEEGLFRKCGEAVGTGQLDHWLFDI